MTQAKQRSFTSAGDIFSGLKPDHIAALMLAHSHIALALDHRGLILDVAYRSPDIAHYGCDNWIGRNFIDVVTPECHPKVRDMLVEVKTSQPTRKRQLNHAAPDLDDIPVDYVLHSVVGMPGPVALGIELRQQVELQQQLINTQIDLERRNRETSEKAARYRAFFQSTALPVVIIEGKDLKISDINAAAGQLFGANGTTGLRKLIGENVTSLFSAKTRNTLSDNLFTARNSGEETILTSKDARDNHEMTLSALPFREQGSVNLVLTISHEKTADGETSAMPLLQALKPDMLPEACVIISDQGAVVATNDPFVDLVGAVSRVQVVDRNLSTWIGASSVDLNVLLSKLKETGTVRRFSTVLNNARGESTPIILSAHSYIENNRSQIAVLIMENERSEGHFSVQASGELTAGADFSELIGRVPLKELIRDAADIIEKMCIEAALRQTKNNRASAADLLGLSRQSLYLKLRRYGLEDYRPGQEDKAN